MIDELIQILGLVASLTVVGAYLQTNRTGDDAWLNWANTLCWPFIAVASVAVGAWPAVLITVMFGTIGTWGLWKNRKSSRYEYPDLLAGTPDQRAAAKLASKRGLYFESVQSRMSESDRLKARDSLRKSRR